MVNIVSNKLIELILWYVSILQQQNCTHISAPPCRSCRIGANVVSLLKILNQSDGAFDLQDQNTVKEANPLLSCTAFVCSSMFPPAIVCRNSLKVSDKYDRAVDNASAELRYNDSSGAAAFTSLLIKKNSCSSNEFDFSVISSAILWLIQGTVLYKYIYY